MECCSSFINHISYNGVFDLNAARNLLLLLALIYEIWVVRRNALPFLLNLHPNSLLLDLQRNGMVLWMSLCWNFSSLGLVALPLANAVCRCWQKGDVIDWLESVLYWSLPDGPWPVWSPESAQKPGVSEKG